MKFTSPWTLLLALLGVLALPAFAQGDRGLVMESLPDLLERGAVAFASGDFSSAAAAFRRIDHEFREEPEFQDGRLTERLFPVWGFAEMRAGDPNAAARVFERFLEKHPQHNQAAFVLYGLGTALRQAERLDDALDRLAEYEDRFPGQTETALARLQRGEILFALARDGEAIELLETFSEGDGSPTLRTQARLRALRAAVDGGRLETAARLLFDFVWQDRSMPEAAVLSFAAMEAGDLFLERGDAASALRAYRRVLPRDELVHEQHRRLEEVRVHLEAAQDGRAESGYRHDYYRGLVQRMERQLAALEEGEDYTTSLLLRRGQAFLLAGRGHEAWLIFESLTFDPAIPESLRQEAHYRWILAANELRRWEESLAIARHYFERYPASPLLAEAIFLTAQAHAERNRHDEAIEVLTELLERFPGHALRQRWLFARGFNRVLLDNFPTARTDFVAARDEAPSTPLGETADLWEALTWFFEREYETALERFTGLAGRFVGRPLEGEVRYRKGTTLYAIREYDSAIAVTSEFLEKFPRHQREPEAHILLGNIRMGTGDLDLAFADFGNVSPEDEEFFPHAVFQQGKILQARQEYREMVAHFTRYLDASEEESRPRTSEALYWIGWAQSQMGRPEQAFPVFLQALEQYGDSPGATEIQSILTALQQLHSRARDGEIRDLPGEARRLLESNTFAEWLETERRRALETNRPTYFANLSLRLANIAERQGQADRTSAVLFDIDRNVAEDRMPPAVLARVGLLFVERNLAAGEAFLERLLREFPDAPERAIAYYGLGRVHLDRTEYARALLWLRRFQHETPVHDLSGTVGLLTGEALLQLGKPREAVEVFEEILQLRQHRGRTHAEALIGIARAMEDLGEKEKAIAYYQRVYTLYRAFNDLVAMAYFRSGNLFADIGNTGAARNSFLEITNRENLKQSPYYHDAVERLEALPDVEEAETATAGETETESESGSHTANRRSER